MAGMYGAGTIRADHQLVFVGALVQHRAVSTPALPAIASSQPVITPWKNQVKSQACSGFAAYWNVATQSAAVSGLPSLQVSPWRSLKVQVLPSSLPSQESADARDDLEVPVHADQRLAEEVGNERALVDLLVEVEHLGDADVGREDDDLLLGRRGISRRRTLPQRGGHPPTLERGRAGVGGQEARGHCRGVRRR